MSITTFCFCFGNDNLNQRVVYESKETQKKTVEKKALAKQT